MTVPATDHYSVLGLSRDASQAEIGAAFRTLLRRHHPDTRPPGDVSQDHVSDVTLQQVLTAYETLRDPGRRATYDEQTGSRRGAVSGRRHPIQVSRTRPPEEPFLQAGPVHWIPPQ